MNHRCEYGCGQEALFRFENGKWCCSDYSNSCPTIKQKNKGNGGVNYFISEDLDSQTILCKYGCGKVARYLIGQGKEKRPCCSKFYSQCEAVIEKARLKNVGSVRKRGSESKLFERKKPDHSQLMKKKNPMFNQSNKRKHLDVVSSENYKKMMSELVKLRWTDDYKEKYSKSLLEKGLKYSDEEVGVLRTYYRKVYKFTKESIKRYGYIINPDNKQIGIGDGFYNVDHIYSIIDGFVNNIDPEIVGSVINLQMLEWRKNIVKNHQSWISLQELQKRYEKFYESIV